MTGARSAPRNQRAFAAALLDPALPTPTGIAVPAGIDVVGRFAVHRNNVLSGLVEALRDRFPATAAIVGPEFFGATAAAFVRRHPPAGPVLAEFGDALPGFLATFAPAAAVPYLADVAQVEAARTRAFHAPDDPAATPAADVTRAGLRVRGGAAIVASDHPVVTVWEMNVGIRPAAPIADWSPECALVVRRGEQVAVTRSDATGAALLAAARRGRSALSACAAAQRADPARDPVAALAALVAAGAVALVDPAPLSTPRPERKP